MTDFDTTSNDNFIEGRGASMQERGVSESALGRTSKDDAPVYDEKHPPPLRDGEAVKNADAAISENQKLNEKLFAEGLKAAQDKVAGVHGARIEIGSVYNAAAGKEVPVVNTYTPDTNTEPQPPQKLEEGK